jgi:ankyrin repeat protein
MKADLYHSKKRDTGYLDRKIVKDILEACRNGNIAVLAGLSDRCSILNEIEQMGISPLVVASQYGHTAIVRYILQHKYYIIDPEILSCAATVAKIHGQERVRTLLTLYYIRYCRYSA